MWINPKSSKVSDDVSKQLNDLLFKCINRKNGWSSIQKYSEVVSHDKSWPFHLVCWLAHPRWNQKYLKKDILLHEKSCGKIMISCPFWEAKDIERENEQIHFRTQWNNAIEWNIWKGFYNKNERYVYLNKLKPFWDIIVILFV